MADGPSSQDLVSTLSRLQTLLPSLPDTEAFLQQLTELSSAVVEPPVSCGITVRHDGQPLTAASSDERAGSLDETQYQAEVGPCLHSLATGEVVEMADVAYDERWPAYTGTARELGLRCSLSLPLTVRGVTLGAMNVYSFDAPGALGGENRHRLEVFAAQAAGALQLTSARQQDRSLREQLEMALTSRSVIDQALGILMGQQRCTVDEAFALLRLRSQNSQVKLREVAADLILRVTGHPPTDGRVFDQD